MIRYPNDWEIKRLKELGEIVTGNTPSKKHPEYYGGNIPWVKPSDLDKVEPVFKTEEYLTHEGVKLARILSKETVMVSCIGNLGKVGIAGTSLATNQQINAIIFNEKIFPKYGYYACRRLQKLLEHYAPATTLPIITKSRFSEIQIPVPPLPVQRKIASILEKAESAREKRKEASRLTDEFLKSAFLEMFGDPARNPKKWPVKRFDEIYASIRYAIGSPPEYKEQGIPFIRATNIKNGTVIMKGMKYISLDDAKQIEKCKLSHGNLVIVRSGVNAGDCALIPEEFDGSYAAYDLIVELPSSSAVFYNHLINSTFGKTMIAPLKRRAGQPHLNATQIGSLKFIAPPLKEQQKFAELVRKVEKLKEKQSESEKELNNLFNSLMQRAFREELV